jgi:glycerol-3-phosphate acyltransferase PlsY
MLLGILGIVIGYLLGAIPSAYVMASLRKSVDIRKFGVGNIGAMNAFRHIGIWEGIVVGVADVAKGAVAILIAQVLGVSEFWWLGSGFTALLGHNFPVFLGFKGGKGSVTAIGIFLLLVPKEMGLALGIMALTILVTRNLVFALGIGFAFVPLFIWLFSESSVLIFFSLAIIGVIGLTSLLTVRKVGLKRSTSSGTLTKAGH